MWALWVWKPCNPLKSHKTAKAFFGKAWRKTTEIWKNLEAAVRLRAATCRAEAPHAGLAFPTGRSAQLRRSQPL